MSSLKSNFDELRRRVRDGRELGYASFEPIYYLVFPPQEIINVKRQTPAWIASLRNDGWDVQTFSIAEQVNDIFTNYPLRNVWLAADRNSPLEWARTNKSLANALTVNRDLLNRLERFLEQFAGRKNALILVTDLESLHPYLRSRTLESELQGKFHAPTVFLYPGTRTGKTGLKFLGFYKEDGGYRSVHIGG
jgi:Domain of unknown function (DUF1788)